MKIKFLGTRGSIPVPGKDTTIYGGNTTCLEITLASGRKVIIDAGTGIRSLGDRLSVNGKKVDIHLLMTHIHWDHLLGFPFFAPIYNPESRIRIDGFRSCMKGLQGTFDNKMGDGFFPIKFNALKADIRHIDILNRSPLTIDDVVIDCVPLQHPQGGMGFRFREGDRTLVFMTDNELTDESWAQMRSRDYIPFCKGADILIHDAQYTPEEIGSRKGWGHSDYSAALRLARESGVKRLVLFHHDPARKDPEVMSCQSKCGALAEKIKADVVVEAAKEDEELTL